MSVGVKTKLNPKKRYLQVALNGSLEEARKAINELPINNRIILEAGTPFIKRYGTEGIRQIKTWYRMHIAGISLFGQEATKQESLNNLQNLFPALKQAQNLAQKNWAKTNFSPYVIADMKTMDRGETEVSLASSAGADAVVALGSAPIETLDAFIASCHKYGLDPMIDMMNVEYPLAVLRKLKKVPSIVVLHRGVDEENYNKQKMLPLHEIRRIKGSYDILIAIAGGDTIREVKSAIFNDADIVVIWKSIYAEKKGTKSLIESFLSDIK